MAEYKFPVAIGDTVTAVVEEDNIVDIIHYKVFGVAQVGNKQYVIDKHGDSFEIGSKLCLLGIRETKR